MILKESHHFGYGVSIDINDKKIRLIMFDDKKLFKIVKASSYIIEVDMGGDKKTIKGRF